MYSPYHENCTIFCVLFSDHYSVMYPVYTTNEERKNNETTFFKQLNLEAPVLNLNFSIDLSPSQNLLASNFTFLETYSNGSYVIPHEVNDTTCYYRSLEVALSLCNGIVSIFSICGLIISLKI